MMAAGSTVYGRAPRGDGRDFAASFSIVVAAR
jgi:hypothetical protein